MEAETDLQLPRFPLFPRRPRSQKKDIKRKNTKSREITPMVLVEEALSSEVIEQKEAEETQQE